MTILISASNPLSLRKDLILTGANYQLDEFNIKNIEIILEISDNLSQVFVQPRKLKVLESFAINHHYGTVVVDRVEDTDDANLLIQLGNQYAITFMSIGNIEQGLYNSIVGNDAIIEQIVAVYNGTLDLTKKTTIHEIGGLKRKQEGTFD